MILHLGQAEGNSWVESTWLKKGTNWTLVSGISWTRGIRVMVESGQGEARTGGRERTDQKLAEPGIHWSWILILISLVSNNLWEINSSFFFLTILIFLLSYFFLTVAAMIGKNIPPWWRAWARTWRITIRRRRSSSAFLLLSTIISSYTCVCHWRMSSMMSCTCVFCGRP